MLSIRAARFFVKHFLFIFFWGMILSKNCSRKEIISVTDIAINLNT